MDSKQWRELAVQTYERAAAIDHDQPGSLVAVELYARAGAEAAIATAFAVGGAVKVPSKRKPVKGKDAATTEVVSHRRG
jgi:hypothetical protein